MSVDILPFEVLSDILVLACWEKLVTPLFNGESYFRFKQADRYYCRMTCARLVCKHWSDVIEATPFLWGLLFMDPRDRNLNRFRTSLKVAQERRAPLDIHLHWIKSQHIDMEIEALTLLMALVARWERFFLCVELGEHAPATLLRLLVLPDGVEAAHILQDFGVRLHKSVTAYQSLLTLSDINRPLLLAAPQLSSLWLYQVPAWFIPGDMNNLTHLEYASDRSSPGHLFSVLQLARNLITIRVDLTHLQLSGTGVNEIQLPSLQSLVVENGLSKNASSFLRLIEAPQLHTILFFHLDEDDCLDINNLFRSYPDKCFAISDIILGCTAITEPPVEIYATLLSLLPQIMTLRIDFREPRWLAPDDFYTTGSEMVVNRPEVRALLRLEVIGMGDEDLVRLVQGLGRVGRTFDRIILEEDNMYRTSTIRAVQSAAKEVKFIDYPATGNGESNFYIYLDGLTEDDCVISDISDTSYSPPASDAEQDPDSSTWDTDSEHSVESGDWASGDGGEMLCSEFRALLTDGTMRDGSFLRGWERSLVYIAQRSSV